MPQCTQEEKKRYCIFTTDMAVPQHKNPCPRAHETENFGRLFLGHQNFIPSLSDLCLSIERMFLKEIMHFHFMTYGHAPAQEPMPQWSSNLQSMPGCKEKDH